MRELGYYCFNPTGYYIHFLTEKGMKDHIDRTNSDTVNYLRISLSRWNIRDIPDPSKCGLYLEEEL